MQNPAFGINLIQLQLADLRYAESMPEHEEEQTPVAGLVPAALSRLDQPGNFAPGEVLPVAALRRPDPFFPTARPRRRVGFSCSAPVRHFVESSPRQTPRKPL
jgi:hypothetical protein